MASMINTVISTSAPLLFICLLIGLLSTQTNSQQPHYCPNTTTYTTNSTYYANLNNLLSVLSSNATRVPESGFFQNNTSADSNPNDTVYGSFMCRGDVTTDECQECVAIACKGILNVCPFRKKAIVWYEKCFLRYSDSADILTEWDDPSVSIILWNPQNVTTDPARFRRLLTDMTTDLVARAVITDGSEKKYATKEAEFTESQKVYALTQCTPYLSTDGCHNCLENALLLLLDCCEGKYRNGVTILFPSCNIRYQFYLFYTMVASPPPYLPLSHPPKSNSTSTTKGKGEVSTQVITAIVVSAVAALVLFSIGLWCIKSKARKRLINSTIQETNAQSLQYDLRTIQAATNNFCNDNKIGEGGFGAVYKGTLPNGQEIAVKRLSKSSVQGGEELKNEVVLVAKLQHRNLVRLVGFCLERQEKILIYEFVPNKSLDYFLFDSEKRKELDWPKRYKIIDGIARGILYLHEDSQPRIIHRDLKGSNVLLDEDMNPKLADFGMARIFGADQTRGSTSRIVGTFIRVFKFSEMIETVVTRLSKSSVQGGEELKIEVVLVAKLQHRNLVRLVGFCLERQEKILIYEFVPNKSLDYILFDSEKRKELDWPRRYKIIAGIARGILYLHEDSRPRIIHRDLKASNVLLDEDMNPKLADFGMARIFGADQTRGSTSRIVGTFGYMSPEYAMQGQFSVKSDVFSFGVSVLEIISGKKNSSLYQSYGPEGLLGYAWKQWIDGSPLGVVDSILGNSYSREEIIRCIHIGLLCVQEDMNARPSMPSVLHMLNSSLETLPLPQQPPFSIRGRRELNSAESMELYSLNEVSVSELDPR